MTPFYCALFITSKNKTIDGDKLIKRDKTGEKIYIVWIICVDEKRESICAQIT